MVRSLRERLGYFRCRPEVVKRALLPEDVTGYQLPPDLTKATDTRRAGFVAAYGDVAVELDALPIQVLSERLRSDVASRLDTIALDTVRKAEENDRRLLVQMLKGEAG